MNRSLTTLLLCASLALPGVAAAQAATASPAKKELVARLIKLQQPAVEALARRMVEAPASQLLQRAAMVVQARIEPEQRQAVYGELQAEARRYVDETYPLVREKGIRLAPAALGPILEEKLTEAELREIVRIVESPTWQKFQGLGEDLQRALGEKVFAEVKEPVEQRVRALDQKVAQRLGNAIGAASAPGTGK